MSEALDPDYPEPPPVVIPHDRGEITEEGTHPMGFEPEWIGWEQQGGGYVPPSYDWTSNPKQLQEDLGGG